MDPETPVEPGGEAAPQQQVQDPPTAPPATENWEARYKGLQPKVEELTVGNRNLNAQLTEKISEIERLQAQLSGKDVEKNAAVGEYTKQLEEKVTALQQTETELAELRALQLKVEVANELGRPELIKLADQIGNVTDKEALKTIMTNFSDFVDVQVKQRTDQLLSGITPVNTAAPEPSAPQSYEAWEQKVEALPLGTPERAQAIDAMGEWLQKNQ